MSAKSTPGPWRVERDENNKRAQTIIRDANGWGVARIVRNGLESDDANANLIAASSMLAGALETSALCIHAAHAEFFETCKDVVCVANRAALRAAGRLP